MREIRAFLEEQYGVEVSPELISTVTDAVMESVQEWQNRRRKTRRHAPTRRAEAVVAFQQAEQLLIDNSGGDHRRGESLEQLLTAQAVHHHLTSLPRTRLDVDLGNDGATVPVRNKRLATRVTDRVSGTSGPLHRRSGLRGGHDRPSSVRRTLERRQQAGNQASGVGQHDGVERIAGERELFQR